MIKSFRTKALAMLWETGETAKIDDRGAEPMTDIVVHRYSADRAPLHPGAVLDNIIPDVGKSKTEIASLLGISRQYL